MTLSEFNSLNLKDQMETTWQHGVIEDNLIKDDYHYIVYRVYEFYVEMAYHSETEDFVQIRSFN